MDDLLLFDDERALYATHFDVTGMLRGDTVRRYQSYQIGLLNGFLSRNEVRAQENLNPIPGGDEYRVPLNTGDPLGGGMPAISDSDNSDKESESEAA